VGIGTTNPLAKLHVKGNQILLKNEADADVGFVLDSGSTTTYRDVIYFKDRGTDIFGLEKTSTNAFQLYDYAGTGVSRILVEAGTNSGISFRTKGTGDFSFINDTTTRVTIKSDGKVGIGTASPTAALEVMSGNIETGGSLFFTDSAGTPYTDSWIGRYNDGTNDWLHIGGITTSGVRRIGLYANTTYANGNVGIGTTGPRNNLEVGNTTSNQTIRVGGVYRGPGSGYTGTGQETTRHQVVFSSWRDAVTDTIGAKIVGINKTAYVSPNWDLVQHTDLAFFTLGTMPVGSDSTTEKMRITSGGNVGIGTTSPATKLELAGTSASIARFNVSSSLINNKIGAIEFRNGSNSYMSKIESYASDTTYSDQTDLRFFTTFQTIQERVRINSLGNVGIGTASPEVKLDVTGDALVKGGDLQIGGASWANQAGLYIDKGASTAHRLLNIKNNNGSAMYIEGNRYVHMPAGHGADLAENFYVSGTVLRGSLVSADNTTAKTVVASIPAKSSFVGVVSTKPSLLMDTVDGFQVGNDTKAIYTNEKAPIALAGTVPILVSSVNGPIDLNSPISTSSIPGFGAKAITPGQIVGKAVESFIPSGSICPSVSSLSSISWPEDDGSNPSKPCFRLPDGTYVGKIMAFVNVSWYDPTVERLLERIEELETLYNPVPGENEIFNILTLGQTSGINTLKINASFSPTTDNQYSLGNSTNRWKDIYTQGTINLGNTTDNGGIKYDTETKRLKFTNDGQNWIPLGPPKKSVLLSAQYPGSVILDNPDVKGIMTTNSTDIDNNSMNYYEWVSSKPDLNTNKIKIRYQIPSDFKQWGDGGITFKYATESIDKEENKLDLYVYDQASNVPETISLNHVSSVEEKWESVEVLGLPFNKCSTPEDVCIFVIEMSSSKDYYTRVGDIEIKYERNL
jgi:hypothetical protein